MSKTSNIRLTVLSCLVLVSLVIGVFVYSIVSPKELTKDEYKDLKFYELSAPRQLTDFSFSQGQKSSSKQICLRNGIWYSWDLPHVLICVQ